MFKLNKIIEYLLYLFVFLLPFQTRLFLEKGYINGGLSEFQTLSLYAGDIILVVLFSLFLVHRVRNFSAPKKMGVIWWLLSGLDLMIFLSIFVAEDHILSIYRYGIFLLGAGLFWVLVKAEYSRVRLYLSLFAALFIQAGIGIWQFLTQSDIAWKWLGMALHSPAQLGTVVVEVAENGGRWLRAYGGMSHPNILGGVLAIGVLILMGVIVNYGFKKKNFSLFSLISYLLLFTFITSLFFTFSRGAWLSLLVGLFVWFVFNYVQGNKSVSRKLSKVTLFVLMLVIILSGIFSDLVSTRLSGGGGLEARSNTERVQSLGEAWGVITKNPLLGAGVGNYTLALQQEHPDRSVWGYQPVHNAFLLVWAEIGFIGSFFFVSILAWIAAILYQRRDHQGLAILASLLVILVFEHWIWSLHFGMLFFWFVLGMIYKSGKIRKRNVGS